MRRPCHSEGTSVREAWVSQAFQLRVRALKFFTVEGIRRTFCSARGDSRLGKDRLRQLLVVIRVCGPRAPHLNPCDNAMSYLSCNLHW